MDKREIAQLYENFGQDVYRLALSYLHNFHDAENFLRKLSQIRSTSHAGG